ASNHHNIEVVRLGKSETFFGSHSRLYDSGDIDAVSKGRDSKNNKIMQKASVHEIGHLLGLGHVAIGSKNCPSTGDTNKAPCYGVTDFEKNSVMGRGMKVRKSNAKPWKDAMDHFSRSKLHERVAKAHRSEIDPLKIGFSLDYWPAEFASFPMTKVPTRS
ncbi:hypothetical protein L1065_13505, partial [Nereida sp. MMG024]|nr:hypothetical protein [Nereida sp. MMG025]